MAKPSSSASFSRWAGATTCTPAVSPAVTTAVRTAAGTRPWKKARRWLRRRAMAWYSAKS
ncbi:hypothetical protein [Amycolatopsis nalaikhensis]|uniref:Uncharacterized protein n=1 Tax=Amycolatopsis nalaikhensis TaxID=715472 RepID=A0ABY8XF59_9PSEU|nr:hypothetical protein [Amycolatopsis sp. 2-2]WIV54251.1 hypothetical protein QP939_36060 [Amycolatopsis sp. 2-2]